MFDFMIKKYQFLSKTTIAKLRFFLFAENIFMILFDWVLLSKWG